MNKKKNNSLLENFKRNFQILLFEFISEKSMVSFIPPVRSTSISPK